MISRLLLLLLAVASSRAYFLSDEECLNYTVYPVQYDITIIPHLFENERFYYDCELTIIVIANAPDVMMIELDAKDMEIKRNSIKVLEGNSDIINPNRPYEYDEKMGKLYIYLSRPLLPYSVQKTQYHIQMSFNKYVRYDSSGVFIVRYEDKGQKYLITTRLSPNKAKYFFPCFDNPKFEAIYKFRVYVPPPRAGLQYTNTSLVIAKELKRNTITDNYVIIEYIPSAQVGLHQVGFHYSLFDHRQVKAKTTNDTLIVWAPSSSLQYYGFILEFGERLINLIHRYSSTNRPLVYGPINLVAVPTILNGYEIDSWNLLTNGDCKLAYVPEYTSIKQMERMTFELAQQMSRIWLGNPGESERTRWIEQWFKEGVATYLAYYFLAQYNHGTQTGNQRWPLGRYAIEMRNKAMAIDWHHNTPALATFNRTLAVEIPSRYKELVAMKTASILWMIENWLGSDKFHQALVTYINSRRGKYISLIDFMTHLDLDSVECLNQFFGGSPASKVLDYWFHGPGYPVVYVEVFRDRYPNVIQLKQRQFSFVPSNRPDTYLIPISYVVQNNQNCVNCYRPRFTIGMKTYSFEENLNDGWIILNTNASGYYRVNYDTVTWKLIAKALKEDRLSIDQLNRAQIVNDALALYAAGYIDLGLAMEILDYLDSETSEMVWNSVASGFELLKIEHANCGMTKALYEQWQEFIRSKVGGIYNRLVDDIELLPETRLFRSTIIEFACSVNYQPCVNKMRSMYNGYRRRKLRLDPDSREALYCILLSDNGAYFARDKLSRFEQDDYVIAEHKVDEERRFFNRIPAGIPRPMPIIMSTTTEILPVPSTETVKVDSTKSSSSVAASAIFIALTTLIIAITR